MRPARDPRESRIRLLVLWVVVLFPLATPRWALADEFPIIPDSTVIGRNYGYPSGTPETGQTCPGCLDLVFETAFSCKNLELTGYERIDGETFIGARAPLRLRYRRPDNQLSMEGGAVLGQNFGDEDKLDEAEPLLRLVFEPNAGDYVIAGTIIPTHWIHDALYDDVNIFRDVEQGFQYRSDREWFKEDLWINWRSREREDHSERFEGASATQFRLRNLWLDGQVFWAHVGGQKNTERRVVNNATLLCGGSYGLCSDNLFLKPHLRMGAYYLIGSNDSRLDIEDANGDGWEVRTTLDLHPGTRNTLRLFAAHYSGNGLPTRLGDPLYAFDKYSQAGLNLLLYPLPSPSLRIELGTVNQYVDEHFMYTFQLHIVWGQALPLYCM